MDDLQKEHHRLSGMFVELSNTMKAEGHDQNMVLSALTNATATYATYCLAGNEGYLYEAGINQVCERFRTNLEVLQGLKKAEYARNNPEAAAAAEAEDQQKS